MIEVLVTFVVVSLGLFGLAALQAKLQLSEVDAYQRAQALLLVQDMSDRITANRKNTIDYVTGSDTALGTGDDQPSDCTTIAAPTVQKTDACQWSNALKGAAEQEGAAGEATLTGAMIGAQGCIESIATDTYLVSVVWQGLTPLAAPSDGLACGLGDYDGEVDSPCQNNLCRRAISSIVRIGTLAGTGP